MNNVLIRNAVETDLPFIYATWLKGLYHDKLWPAFRVVHQDTFYPNYHRVIESILSRSTVFVACLEDEPDVVLGYSVVSGNTLHWIFIKKAWRGNKIAKQLVPVTINSVSHLTKLGQKLKPKEWEYNPFL